MDLQELITRGRFLFTRAPKRLEVFKNVDGKRNTKEVATASGRSHVTTLIDLRKMKDCGLIQEKISDGKPIKREDCTVYEKLPLVRQVPISYFKEESIVIPSVNKGEGSRSRTPRETQSPPLGIPSENELLEICREGEGQLHEFKEPRVETEKIAKEVAAFANTKRGGLLFYGVADDGSIIGTDRRRQEFDQTIQNSVQNTISPKPNIVVSELPVLGQTILVVRVPPWDRKSRTPFQYTKDNRFYIRKGSNVFALTAEEISKLGRGEYVV
jgi:hypothetical protein